ncbi:MAG: sigma-54-dependent transcriptional regulator [Gammaproteobacteria bacterium]
MSPPTVLLVDDDAGLLHLLGIRLRGAGYAVETATSADAALPLLASGRVQVLVTDLRMPGIDGMELFNLAHAREPALPIIVLTAHGTIADAAAATRRGVFAYLTKPFDGQELVDWVERALRVGAPEPEPGHDDWASAILTRSAAMQEMLGRAYRIARTDVNVLIQSESGTGKELLARAIHLASRRADRPFVAVNCAAFTESLLESELFGHVRGAFTGATRDHEGLFRTAHGGTLFLDEIGDMAAGAQAHLLRAVQEKEVRRIGATAPVPADVRIVCATHRDLEAEVVAGRFREDLYYRLDVARLELPPLRDRREDIPLLAAHFLQSCTAAAERPVAGFGAGAMELLIAAPWPGNVRKLRNVVEQCAALATAPLVTAELVRTVLRGAGSGILTYTQAHAQFEREYLMRLMSTTAGNVSQAARLAGRERSRFYRLLRRHALVPERFRTPGT